MICVLALIGFSIAGIFSATHRKLAIEAWECVTSRVKREPCDTRLDERLEASIVGKTLDYSPKAAKILKKHFEIFSWVLLIFTIATGLVATNSLYNWAVHGNCNGPDADEGCELEKIPTDYDDLELDDQSANQTVNTTEVAPG